MIEDEKLDHFLQGLSAVILKNVLMADITFFTDACQASERAAAILSYIEDRQLCLNQY